MQIFIFPENNPQAYSEFVATHSSGSFLQSWSWGEFQKTLERKIVRIGIAENEQIIGTVQLIKTKVPYLPGYYLYAPYGPLIKEADNNETTMEALLVYLQEHFPDCWFFRFEPKYQLPLSGLMTQRIQPSKTLVTNIEQPAEELLAAMHPKTRYNIKVASKHGVMVSSSAVDTSEAINLLTETSKRQNYHSYPASYYKSLLNYFGSTDTDCKVHLYEARYKEQLASCAIMVDHGYTRTYLFGGSNDAFKTVMAPYALHWQAITDARASGIAYYDWWGIETATGKMPGFVQFKLKWGGEQIEYPPTIDIVQNTPWYMLYSLLRKLNRLF